jgi:hypothetical protein
LFEEQVGNVKKLRKNINIDTERKIVKRDKETHRGKSVLHGAHFLVN